MICKIAHTFGRSSAVLDVGCSGGQLLEALRQMGFTDLHGIDIDKKSIEICIDKNIKNVSVAKGEETGFSNDQFDLLVASDVLEHIGDELKALQEWKRVLRPKGKVLIFVPAFKSLWSSHDVVNCHYRRYNRKELLSFLTKNGFSVERVSYWNFLLFFPVVTVRIFGRVIGKERNKKTGELDAAHPLANGLLSSLLRIENRLLSSGINFPFGISLFAVASKP